MDELITTEEKAEFINEILQERGFIRAKYAGWEEPRNGLIVYATKAWLRVLFLTGVNVSTSYYTITVADVVAGLWQVTYTNDLKHFYTIEGGKAKEDVDLETAIRNIFKGGDDDGTSDEGNAD